MSPPSGYLEIILGPMFSGKTTRLIRLYHDFSTNGKTPMVINYAEDRRYHDTMLSTHDKNTIPCLFAHQIKDLLTQIEDENPDIILINEGQFFDDIYETVLTLVDQMKKQVFVCGLDGDFRRKPFGRFLELIPVCDNIVKLVGQCSNCGNKNACFTHRLSDNRLDQVFIGGSKEYSALCRPCFLNTGTIL
jgi:thymidine kinase